MKHTQTLIPTMREIPSDADAVSHQLLLRAGFLRQNSSGVYSFLPLAVKVIRKIEMIIREELNAIEAVEVLLPVLQQVEVWQKSGRLDTYGSELFRLQDRHSRQFVLGPTHEEVITTLVRDEVKSTKKLPLTLYQIQTKFRDEQRPRFGLLRGREFMMKDAYSFHDSEESLDEKYTEIKAAYSAIFTRLGLDFRIVLADGGTIGGADTDEFMALSAIGEDTIAYSDSSDYAANIEIAPVNVTYEKVDESLKGMEKIATPNQRSIQEVTTFLNIDPARCIKTLLFSIDGQLSVVLCRGDHEINDIKLMNALGASSVELANANDAIQLFSCEFGSIGPVKLPLGVQVYADHAIQSIVNGVCGANEDGYHFVNVNPERDFEVTRYEDLRYIQEGDPSPDGNGTIQFTKGIELGHIFKLGTVYSEKMGATFLDDNGKSQPYRMGCYGIGISRILAAIAEQYHDENGLKWPKKIAPFDIHIIAVNSNDDRQRELADELYFLLKSYRYDVLYDDRSDRAGVKFADADLIGLPVRITVGKKAEDGIVEVKFRQTGESFEWQKEEVTEKLQAFFAMD